MRKIWGPLLWPLGNKVVELAERWSGCLQARCCWRRRWRRPGWLQLLTSRDFGAISLINGIMFMTANGSRSVLVPLHGVQAFGLTTTIMGAPPPPSSAHAALPQGQHASCLPLVDALRVMY